MFILKENMFSVLYSTEFTACYFFFHFAAILLWQVFICMPGTNTPINYIQNILFSLTVSPKTSWYLTAVLWCQAPPKGRQTRFNPPEVVVQPHPLASAMSCDYMGRRANLKEERNRLYPKRRYFLLRVFVWYYPIQHSQISSNLVYVKHRHSSVSIHAALLLLWLSHFKFLVCSVLA